MISELFYKKFGEAIKTANFFSYPLVWSSAKKRLEYSRAAHANAISVHIVICLKLLFFFGLILWHKNHVWLSEHNLVLLMFYTVLGLTLGSTVFVFQPCQVAVFWNGMFLYGRTFQGKRVKCAIKPNL